MSAGSRRVLVAFDEKVETPDGSGGRAATWSELQRAWAELRYAHGREAVQAGKVTGSAVFKVKVRSDPVTRALTAAHRMRDLDRGLAFNIREVDPISDPASVWLVVESGVAI